MVMNTGNKKNTKRIRRKKYHFKDPVLDVQTMLKWTLRDWLCGVYWIRLAQNREEWCEILKKDSMNHRTS
jgi:hypothetical protein